MRLHSLELSGFLAYGGQDRVDFDSLSDAGFFLIHGETGSGKTALLDAIAFALYGQLPGARKGVKSIRSSHAAADTPTYVVLDATVGSQRLRIRRSPAYLRPKARGTGSTESKASVEVERWNGSAFEPGPTAAQDANIYIREWIGFGPDQFFRLALIPQGQFADFLHSSSKDRKELLKELFKQDHAVFGRIEDFFKNQLRQADEDLRAASVELDKQRARIAQVLGDAVEEGEVDGLAWIDARVVAASESLELARQEREPARLAAQAAVAEEARAVTVVDSSEKYRTARAKALAAAEQLTEHRHLMEPLVPLEIADDDADGALEQALQRLAADLAEQEKSNEARERVLTARATVARQALQLEADERALIVDGGELEALLPRIAELRVTAEAGMRAAAELEAAFGRAASAASLADLAGKRDDTQSLLQQAQSSFDAADTAWRDTVNALSAAEAQAMHSHAVVLAGLLRPGEACPVCGSLEHPQPVQGESEFRASTLEELRAALAAVADVRSNALGQLRQREATLSDLMLQLGDAAGAELDALQSAAAAAEDVRKSTAALVMQGTAASESARDLEAEYRQRQQALSQQAEAIANARHEQQQRMAAVQEAERAIGLQPQQEILEYDTGALAEELEQGQAWRSTLRTLLDAVTSTASALTALSEVSTGELPNLAELRALREAAESALRSCEQAVSEQERVVGELGKRRDAFARAEQAFALAAETRTRVAAIANPLTGQTASKTQLTAYYLAARLRQVLDRANGRLRRMTDERFSFVFDAEAKGAGYQSLEIAVHDAWNGAQREVSTLSGGETFTASLALALGLADIVQAEAGGRALDSLFIDEGFGTLSSDFLNRVLQDLDQLRASGRLVGIISHVDELRQRIPMQLEVLKSSRGSSLRLIDADLD